MFVYMWGGVGGKTMEGHMEIENNLNSPYCEFLPVLFFEHLLEKT